MSVLDSGFFIVLYSNHSYSTLISKGSCTVDCYFHYNMLLCCMQMYARTTDSERESITLKLLGKGRANIGLGLIHSFIY